MPEPIAYTESVGGVRCPVYEDARGKYVIDDDGIKVRGIWFIPRDEVDKPLVVPAGGASSNFMRARNMRGPFLTIVALITCLGCSGRPAPEPGSLPQQNVVPVAATTRSKILGRWTTSTAAEMAGSATVINFLDSGEYQASGPLIIQGRTVTVKKNGKQESVPVNLTGTWDLDGDQIKVKITQVNIQAEFQPFAYKIRDVTEKRLLLDRDGKELALFRAP